MAEKILVIGAPGNVGTEVVHGLRLAGAQFRIAAYELEEARQAFSEPSDIVHFNFLDSATYEDTFTGIDRMFLMRPPQLANVQQQIAPAVRAALTAGVKHIVFLSLQGVERNRFVPHHKIEKLLRESGAAYTFLRASFFMQNLSTTHRAEIRDRAEIGLPVGKARTSLIDTRDIAAVAVRALTESGHEHRAYTLTGAEALTYFEVADIMTAVLGRSIRYTDPSVLNFMRRQLSQGHPLGYAIVVSGLYTLTRLGNAKEVTRDVSDLLGRQPISFEQFVRDYQECWL